MDATMDATATRTRARATITLTALLSTYTAAGRAAPALHARKIDQITRTLDRCSCAMWEDTKWCKAVSTATRIHTMATVLAPCPVNTTTGETSQSSRVHKIDHLACARPMLLYSSSHTGQQRIPQRSICGNKDTEDDDIIGTVSCRRGHR